MQDRFEKEVQQKMEEFKLTPSAPVWEKIELEIRPEKKRRRVIFWVLLAGLLLAGGTWWAYQSFDNDQQLSSEDSKSNSQNSTVNSKTTTQNPNQTTNTNNLGNKPGTSNTNDDESNTSSNTVVNNPSQFQPGKKPIKKTFQPSVSNEKSKKENSVSINPINSKKEHQPTGNIPAIKKPINPQSTSVVDSNPAIVTAPSTSSVNDSIAKPFIKKEPSPETLTIDSSLKKKVATNKKWGKQINLLLGGSSFASGFSLLKSTATRDAFSAIGSGGTGLGVVNNTYTAEPTTAGFGFAIGFSFSRKLSEHWEAAFGFQYTQLSTQTKVGDKKQMDTTIRYSADKVNVDEFYTNTGTTNYTNRFHILEIPATISYRPSIKLPLYISAGISYGRLISSNALTFSNTSNIYYENDENYVRNLLPVQASVQYRFRDKKKISLQTGPVIQYNFFKVQKESTDEKSHLLFAGLKTTINF